MTTDTPVSWSEDGPAFVVTLNNPPANQLGSGLITGVNAALDAFAESAERVLVVSSAIDGFFAAGADIKLMAAADTEAFSAYGTSLRRLLDRIARLDRPSIAAIDGRALGGGLELALACSLRIGSSRAMLGLPEPKLGLIPGAGGTQRLPRLVGRGRALDIMLTGREVCAAEAFAIGLLDRLEATDSALAAAVTLSGELGNLSRPALAAILASVDEAGQLPLAEGMLHEAQRVERLFDSPDGREGLAAFLARRPPRFS